MASKWDWRKPARKEKANFLSELRATRTHDEQIALLNNRPGVSEREIRRLTTLSIQERIKKEGERQRANPPAPGAMQGDGGSQDKRRRQRRSVTSDKKEKRQDEVDGGSIAR